VSQQINLFNPIFLQQKKIFSARTMAQALLLLIVGVVALNLYGGMRVAQLQKEADAGAIQLQKKKARLTSVLAEFPPRQKSPAVAAELAEAERQLAALDEVSGVLASGQLGNTRGYADTFRAFARQRVDGLWLTGINVAGNDIGVRGRALNAERIPSYLSLLTREPAMRGKAFGSLQIGQGPPPAGAPGATDPASAAVPPAPYVEFSLLSTREAKP
jgi:Tfp pilus assembly protein PilN